MFNVGNGYVIVELQLCIQVSYAGLCVHYYSFSSGHFPWRVTGRVNAYEYDVGEPPQDEIGVRSISAHRWIGRTIEFEVNWDDGDVTWEPYQTCRNLRALDEYCILQNVRDWKDLPRRNMKGKGKKPKP